jgi:hypothetical protein
MHGLRVADFVKVPDSMSVVWKSADPNVSYGWVRLHDRSWSIAGSLCCKPMCANAAKQPIHVQSTSPTPQRPIMLQPVHRQIGPLVRVLGSQLFIDVHPVAG